MVYYKLNDKIINEINISCSNVFVELNNTRGITSNKLNKIENDKCLFKIWGGIKEIHYKEHYNDRIIYTLKELKKIIKEIEKIEYNMPQGKENKIIYLYDYFRKNIKYTPKEINDKKIRSLCALFTKIGVCSGYSLVFKEMLDRQGIKCRYIKHLNHAWNSICINRKWYEVDLTWDSCVFNKYPSSNIHYFANNVNLREKHNKYLNIKNVFRNDILNKYDLNVLNLKRDDNSDFRLTLLPIGIDRKYYIFEENENKYIISSEDDMEAIMAEYDNEIIMSYINCFFTLDRIMKYYKKGISYIGYGIFKNNCFYRRKNNNEDKYIEEVIFEGKDIIIKTIDKIYKINNNYFMEVVYVKNS